MKMNLFGKKIPLSDPGVLALVALAWLILFTAISIFTSSLYGFHRDELNFIENARHLEWGFIEYPPLTPFIGRIILILAGLSLVAFRFVAALTVCIAAWLAGMITRELGGTRLAQVVAACATVIAPIVLFDARFFSYQTFDFLYWVLIAYLMIRLLKSEDPRWWLAIGAVIGLGMMTKYTIPYLVAGIAAGVFFTPARRDLKSPWLWGGATLGLLIFLPNLLWQVQHGFISLRFVSSIHARDVAIGRTGAFLLDQLYVSANPAAITLWIGGLYFYLVAPAGKRYRALGWMYIVPFLLFLASQGRFYYLAGAYPMLIAAGASQAIRQPSPTSGKRPVFMRGLLFGSLIVMGVVMFGVMVPMAPVGTGWWKLDAGINPEIKEEIGWPGLVAEVAKIHASLPDAERATAGILAGNYGEASAINLYGPAYGLPNAISVVDSFWLRGYGNPPPQTVIVLGATQNQVDSVFESCVLAGHTPNPYHILNEETRDHPDIFYCRSLRQTWPEFWQSYQYFG